MKKVKQTENDELRAEYKRSDFTGPLTRGKYAKRYAEGANVIVIEPDVAKYFPDHDAVNQALRSLVTIIKGQKESPKKTLKRTAKTAAA
jgi:hypothetical protein